MAWRKDWHSESNKVRHHPFSLRNDIDNLGRRLMLYNDIVLSLDCIKNTHCYKSHLSRYIGVNIY